MAGFFGFLWFYFATKVGLPATIPITPIPILAWIGFLQKDAISNSPPSLDTSCPFFLPDPFWSSFFWHLHIRWLVQAFQSQMCFLVVQYVSGLFMSIHRTHVMLRPMHSDTSSDPADPGAPTRAPVSATSALQPSAWSASRDSADSPRISVISVKMSWHHVSLCYICYIILLLE